MIRVRESGLSNIKTNDCIIEQSQYISTNEQDLIETINRVLDVINHRIHNIGREKITYENFTQNKNSIYALLYNKPVKNSIKDTCISRFCDKEKNGDLQPECVSINLNIPIFFKCIAGYSLRILANSYNYKLDKAKNNKYKLFNCIPDYQTSKCEDKQCCPFANLHFCQGSVNCFNQGNNNYPKILCLDKGINLANCQNSKQYYLRFCFFKDSIFELEDCSTGAILINKGVSRIGSMGFSYKTSLHTLKPHESNYFDLQINDSIRENIPNSDLIVYQKFFRPIVGNRGWFLWSIIFLKFDEFGLIKRYKTGLYSKSEGELITSYSNSAEDLKLLINKTFSD